MREVLASLLLLIGPAAASSATARGPIFDPVTLSEPERAKLENCARPFGHGDAIASVRAATLMFDSKDAIVEFEENKRTDEYAIRFAVECFSHSQGSWDCTDPYRIITLLHDALPEIELRGEVSLATIRQIVQVIRRRVGVRLVSVDAIESQGADGYRVQATYSDGFGVHSVTEKDLAVLQ